MIDNLTYKNFIGSVHFSEKDEVFHGKLMDINDLVTYEGTSIPELKKRLKRPWKIIWNCDTHYRRIIINIFNIKNIFKGLNAFYLLK